MSNVQRPMSNVFLSHKDGILDAKMNSENDETLDIGRWTLDIGRWTLDCLLNAFNHHRHSRPH